jgi:SNF2 family DNA or RNA helicase
MELVTDTQSLDSPEQPTSLATALWPHQQRAVEFLEPLGSGALFAEMGTGKTLAAFALADRWGCKIILVLCPKTVVSVWPQEVEKHGAPYLVYAAAGNVSCARKACDLLRRRGIAHATERPFLAVVNYEAAITPTMNSALHAVSWDLVIADESHRAKSPSGKQSWAVARVAWKAPHRLLLTGTPMPHSPLDVYAQMRACRKEVFGSSWVAFRAKYAKIEKKTLRPTRLPDGTWAKGREYEQVVGYQNLPELHERLNAVSVRIRAADVLDLPPTRDIVRTCELGPETRKAYDAMEADLRAEVAAGTITAANGLARLIRLSQITSGIAATESGESRIGQEKGDLLADLLEDIQPGYDEPREPVVVFCRFHGDLDIVDNVALNSKLLPAELSGRVNELRDWQQGKSTVLAVQYQAGGVGVDLSRARYCVFLSPTYSLGDYEQARARVHRPGQTRNVIYYHIVAENSMDQVIQRALDRKADVIASVLTKLRGV